MSLLLNAVGLATHWRAVDLFSAWVKPTLAAHDFGPQSVLPGFALSAISFVGGVVYAGLLPRESGRFRRIEIRGLGLSLKFDPTPRVWNGFLLGSDTAGQLYRVSLRDRRVVVGQISEYSTDPNDALQEILMEVYAVAETPDGVLQQAQDSQGILISRSDIDYIEKLAEIPDA